MRVIVGACTCVHARVHTCLHVYMCVHLLVHVRAYTCAHVPVCTRVLFLPQTCSVWLTGPSEGYPD